MILLPYLAYIWLECAFIQQGCLLVGILFNIQSSRLFAEPSPDESSFVLPGPLSDHYCPSSSPSRSGPGILITNHDWLMLNEKVSLMRSGNKRKSCFDEYIKDFDENSCT